MMSLVFFRTMIGLYTQDECTWWVRLSLPQPFFSTPFGLLGKLSGSFVWVFAWRVLFFFKRNNVLYNIFMVSLQIFMCLGKNILEFSDDNDQLLPLIRICPFPKLDHFLGFLNANIELDDFIFDIAWCFPFIHIIYIRKYFYGNNTFG